MQNADAVLDIIRKRGSRELHLDGIYRQMFNPDLYLRAYGRIYRKAGAMTPGTTRETADGMSMAKVEAIIDDMRHERYRWTPVRRTHIPKTNGKMRPLGIPTWSDKLVQEVMRSLLEAYYEPQFSDLSHGFRPDRGCHTALSHVQRVWTGTTWFIEGDIKGCFDNIDHTVLLSILRDRIHDNRFLGLVEGLLKAGYLEDWRYKPTLSGSPQGGVISPLLSNIYLDRLDTFVEESLLPEFNKGKRKNNKEYKRTLDAIKRSKERGQLEEAHELRKVLRTLPSYEFQDPSHRRLRYVRYADDFLLGFVGPKEEAKEIKDRIGKFLADTLHLEMSPDKTLITHAKTEAAKFLGYEIINATSDTNRAVNGRIHLMIPQDVLTERCSRFKKDGRVVNRPELTVESDFDIIATYGMEYRGFVQYYLLAHNVRWLTRLHWVMQGSLLRTLAYKHKSTLSAMQQKYMGTTLTVTDKTLRCVQVVVEREGKKPLVATFGGISLSRRKLEGVEVDQLDQRIVPRTELSKRLLADQCEVCGSKKDVNVHHVRKLANLKPKGGRVLPLWKKLMAARNRKTLVVCGDCHWKIHNGKPLPMNPNLERLLNSGEPDDVKMSRPVRRGDDGKGGQQ